MNTLFKFENAGGYYSCYIIPDGHAPITVCNPEPFPFFIASLDFLIDPNGYFCLEDSKFVSLLHLATTKTSFLVKISNDVDRISKDGLDTDYRRWEYLIKTYKWE